MPLTAGNRLGPYEIVAPIGAGGMGEVYQARDTRLGRTVAVKILPALMNADPEFRARFDREAKTISQLNHPNICTLFDVGEETPSASAQHREPIAFLVMEYLEGETLAARLEKGPLPIDEALDFAVDIASALDKAHRQGIVHRDLKPGNIMLTATGPKLLDFGLAKPGAVKADTVETKLMTTPPPSQTVPLTSRGSILGTFQYMAPEQIEGEEADARSDIWAFGCVLYEMLTGKRTFDGKTQAGLIGAILERQPAPVAELQPLVPPALGRIVRTCLSKDPDDRFHTAHDLWLHLQWIEEGGSAAGLPAPVVAGRRKRERLVFGVLAAGVAVVAAATAWFVKPAPEIRNVLTKFTNVLPEDQQFTRTGRQFVTMSNDGMRLAYAANNQIFVRSMDQLEAVPVRGTEVDPAEPVFSPDGLWIAFYSNSIGSDQGIWKISVAGGAPVRVADAENPYGMSWSGSTLVFGQPQGIMTVADTGGTPAVLVQAGEGEVLGQPQLVDDGHVLMTATASANSWNDGRITLVTLATGERTVLVPGGTAGRLTPEGQLIYLRDGTLFGLPFDRRAMNVSGGPVPLIENVREGSPSGAGQFAWSENGTLAFVGGSGGGLGLVWVDRSGREEPVGAPRRTYYRPRLSPDGGRIATETRGDAYDDIHIWDVSRSIENRLTFGDGMDWAPVWTRDGRHVVYAAAEPGTGSQFDIFRRRADGTGEVEQLTDTPENEEPVSVSPDDGVLLHRLVVPPAHVRRLPLDGAGEPAPLTDTRFTQDNAVVSPDGRWVAFNAEEGADDEVYVRPFPDTDAGRWQISSGGAMWPVWSPNGRELFFVSRRPTGWMMTVVAVESAPGATTFNWGQPQVLFAMSPYVRSSARGYDVAPDASRFVMVASADGSAGAPTITVVTHWFDEVRARVR